MDMNKLFEGYFLKELVNMEPVEEDEEVGDNEEIIGDMNDLEKSCYAFLELNRKAGKQKIADYLKMLATHINLEEEDLEEKISELQKDQKESEKIIEQMDLVKKIMWDSIESRLNTDGSSIGIRKGFKIVVFESSPEVDKRVLVVSGISSMSPG